MDTNNVTLLLMLLWSLNISQAYTDPSERMRLLQFREALIRRDTVAWRQAVATWTCPTRPSRSEGACDPCGQGMDGNWKHINCRGPCPSGCMGEGSQGLQDGFVTTIHITDLGVEGPLPQEMCAFKKLRELDFDGANITGPLPRWIQTCFPELAELDMTFNGFTGPIPEWLVNIPNLREFKMSNNRLSGTIPNNLGHHPELRRFTVANNTLTGVLPASFRNLADRLSWIEISDNDLEGDLSVLGAAHLVIASVHNNKKLCGMVPSTVRHAKLYNPTGTGLGHPCPPQRSVNAQSEGRGG